MCTSQHQSLTTWGGTREKQTRLPNTSILQQQWLNLRQKTEGSLLLLQRVVRTRIRQRSKGTISKKVTPWNKPVQCCSKHAPSFKQWWTTMLRLGSLKVRLAQVDCVGKFKGKGSGRVFGNCYRLPHVTVIWTKDRLHLQHILYKGFYTLNHMYTPFGAVSENIQRIFRVSTSPLQSLLVPCLRSLSSDGETTVPSLLMERQADEQERLSMWESHCTVDEPTVSYWNTFLGKMPRQ